MCSMRHKLFICRFSPVVPNLNFIDFPPGRASKFWHSCTCIFRTNEKFVQISCLKVYQTCQNDELIKNIEEDMHPKDWVSCSEEFEITNNIFCFAALADKEKGTDLTGALPIMSLEGKNLILWRTITTTFILGPCPYQIKKIQQSWTQSKQYLRKILKQNYNLVMNVLLL